MLYLIYNKENENEFIETVDSAYNYTLTETESEALTFESETSALDMISHLDGTTELWGTRPRRP